MGSLLLCIALIFSLLQMFCGDFISVYEKPEDSPRNKGEKNYRLTASANAEDNYETGDTSNENNFPVYSRRQHSKVWYGSNGIAPESVENIDRDDCVRPLDWEGLQDTYEYDDEFTSSNLKRRSVSDELTSFDKCKQGDEFFVFKHDFNSGNSPRIKDSKFQNEKFDLIKPLALNPYQDLDVISSDDGKNRNFLMNYPNSSILSLKRDPFLIGQNVDQAKFSGNIVGLEAEPINQILDLRLDGKGCDKNKKKSKKCLKKERKRLEKAFKVLSKSKPSLNAWFKEAQKNDKMLQKLNMQEKKTKKGTCKNALPIQSSLESFSKMSNLLGERGMEEEPIVREFEQEAQEPEQGGEIKVSAENYQDKRPYIVVGSPQYQAPRLNNVLVPELIASPVVLTTDGDIPEDEESVTVKVYESALRRGNNSYAFLPSLKEIIISNQQGSEPIDINDFTVTENNFNVSLNSSQPSANLKLYEASVTYDASGKQTPLLKNEMRAENQFSQIPAGALEKVSLQDHGQPPALSPGRPPIGSPGQPPTQSVNQDLSQPPNKLPMLPEQQSMQPPGRSPVRPYGNPPEQPPARYPIQPPIQPPSQPPTQPPAQSESQLPFQSAHQPPRQPPPLSGSTPPQQPVQPPSKSPQQQSMQHLPQLPEVSPLSHPAQSLDHSFMDPVYNSSNSTNQSDDNLPTVIPFNMTANGSTLLRNASAGFRNYNRKSFNSNLTCFAKKSERELRSKRKVDDEVDLKFLLPVKKGIRKREAPMYDPLINEFDFVDPYSRTNDDVEEMQQVAQRRRGRKVDTPGRYQRLVNGV